MTYRLFLDDYRDPHQVHGFGEWVVARNMNEAVETVKSMGLPKVISFDHDLADQHYGGDMSDEKTGYDFAKWFCNYIMDNNLHLSDDFDFYVHSMNPAGAQNIRVYMRQFLKHHMGHWE